MHCGSIQHILRNMNENHVRQNRSHRIKQRVRSTMTPLNLSQPFLFGRSWVFANVCFCPVYANRTLVPSTVVFMWAPWWRARPTFMPNPHTAAFCNSTIESPHLCWHLPEATQRQTRPLQTDLPKQTLIWILSLEPWCLFKPLFFWAWNLQSVSHLIVQGA